MQLEIPFHLDVNQFFGTISTIEDWQKAVSAYEGVREDPISFLLSTKLNPDSQERYGVNRFDYRPFQFDVEKEKSRITLGEWCEQNNIKLQ